MNKFLITFAYYNRSKHDSKDNFHNLIYYCDGAPVLSEIEAKIMLNNNINIDDFCIINIILVKMEPTDIEGKNVIKIK